MGMKGCRATEQQEMPVYSNEIKSFNQLISKLEPSPISVKTA